MGAIRYVKAGAETGCPVGMVAAWLKGAEEPRHLDRCWMDGLGFGFDDFWIPLILFAAEGETEGPEYLVTGPMRKAIELAIRQVDSQGG